MFFRITLAHNFQRVHDMTPLIPLLIDFTFTENLNLQPGGKRIDHRSTHAMETSGYLISAAAKLTAGMKNRKYHFNGWNAGLGMDANWNPASIIKNRNGIVTVDLYVNGITDACQCLIHRVIHYLIHQVMKSFGRGTADIHSRSFPDCFQSF